MFSKIITTEMILSSLLKGIIPVMLCFISVIMMSIIISIIKKGIKYFTFHFSILSGDSKRKAKKNAKIAENLVDLTSSINDMMGAKK